jgi:hypothetical protein
MGQDAILPRTATVRAKVSDLNAEAIVRRTLSIRRRIDKSN